jgi:hypothetical protein
MSRSIVITTIFDPSEAIVSYAKNREYELVVVGDRKTPSNWKHENVKYLSIDHQAGIGKHLKEVLPFNHYCRKMMGYLDCISRGAEYIVDTDDDNIPKENWVFPAFEGSYASIPGQKGFVNVYELYSEQKIWPRGLPLRLINKKFGLEGMLTRSDCKIGVWQGLADEDPDVDAIYRLTSDVPCYFNEREPVVLQKGTLSPFNTQNTITRKELFATMYLPVFVTFRFTDILRSLVTQPIMWEYGYQLGFTNATVVQKRNPHDYMKDFISEIPMYQYTEDVIELTAAAVKSGQSIENNLFNAYEALHKKAIVEAGELDVLNAWLKDLGELQNK